jgi:hypothetical protein
MFDTSLPTASASTALWGPETFASPRIVPPATPGAKRLRDWESMPRFNG